MVLAKAPIKGARWLIADWIEFQVLISEFNVFRLKDLLRISDEDQESENTNIGDQDSRNEELREKAISELDIRLEHLGDSYPFHFESDGSELILNTEITPGGHIYLYCLIFSHIKRNDVLIPEPPASNSDRDLMQICSTLAAAGATSGNAVSFGFPRTDHSGFLEALRSTYSDMGEGRIRDTLRPGSPRNEKDSRMDVIAWSSNPGGSPGKYYLLGQVASGANWDTKSVRGEIEPFHDIWFSTKPSSDPNPAMFIPFCLEVQKDETLNEVLDCRVVYFGRLFYRYLLPHFADIGYRLAEDDTNEFRVDRYNDFEKIPSYVQNFLGSITSYPY